MSLENLLEKLSLSSSTDPHTLENLYSDSDPDQIMTQQFKPEFLNCVPIFDGNPNELNRYLTTCESLITAFYDRSNPSSFQNVYLFHSLLGKLSGNARVIANIQNVSTWDELKNCLRSHFADQRDEACLNRDLVLMRQTNGETPQQFYDRCLQILNLLCAYIDIHETSPSSKQLKRDLYSKIALKTFLSGLKEPLGTTIRCMRPANLNEALQLIMQEESTQYYQSFPYRNPIKTTRNSQQHNFNFRTAQNTQIPQITHFPQRTNYFPSQPVNIQPRRNMPPQRFPKASDVFPDLRRNQNQNVFRPNTPQYLPPPTPMSACTIRTNSNNSRLSSTPSVSTFRSRNSYRPTPMSVCSSNNFRPGPSANHNTLSQIPEELYNTDAHEQYEHYVDSNEENTGEYATEQFERDENFHETDQPTEER